MRLNRGQSLLSFVMLLGLSSCQMSVWPTTSRKILPADEAISFKSLDGQPVSLNASFWAPNSASQPSTLVVMVPGSGMVSRRQMQAGDGIRNYPAQVAVGTLWQQVLADNGYFVLAYDKRTCLSAQDKECATNSLTDVDFLGIEALSADLDAVCSFAQTKYPGTRLVLWSDAQGTQVILKSSCKKHAKAIVLLSPIAGPLDRFWVDGLRRARQERRADSLSATFDSITLGTFDSNARVMGASLNFWKSWLRASNETPKILQSMNQPLIFAASEQDPLIGAYGQTVLANLGKSHAKTFLLIPNCDRNFLNEGHLSENATGPILKALADALKGS